MVLVQPETEQQQDVEKQNRIWKHKNCQLW